MCNWWRPRPPSGPSLRLQPETNDQRSRNREITGNVRSNSCLFNHFIDPGGLAIQTEYFWTPDSNVSFLSFGRLSFSPKRLLCGLKPVKSLTKASEVPTSLVYWHRWKKKSFCDTKTHLKRAQVVKSCLSWWFRLQISVGYNKVPEVSIFVKEIFRIFDQRPRL